MADDDVDELHVEDVEEVGLALAYLDLFDEGFEEDLDGDGGVLADDAAEVAQHEFPHVQFLVVLDE
jgi:hypothetical protein